MARYKGHNGSVTVGVATVGEIKSFDVTISASELDGSIMGSDWAGIETGQKSASGTINVLHDPNDAQQNSLATGSTVELHLYPAGNTSGLQEITGNFVVTSQSMQSNVNDLVQSTYEVKNVGSVTIGNIT